MFNKGDIVKTKSGYVHEIVKSDKPLREGNKLYDTYRIAGNRLLIDYGLTLVCKAKNREDIETDTGSD